MIVLGIDPGTRCGWALRRQDASYVSGVWKLAVLSGEGDGMRLVRLSRFLEALLPAMVDLVAYERVASHRGVYAAHVYGEITGEIKRVAEGHRAAGITYVGIPVGTWKKAAGCKGNCSGETALRAAEARWPEHTFATDDEAAARWIAECAHATYAETQSNE